VEWTQREPGSSEAAGCEADEYEGHAPGGVKAEVRAGEHEVDEERDGEREHESEASLPRGLARQSRVKALIGVDRRPQRSEACGQV
jgi:hypothetical protein